MTNETGLSRRYRTQWSWKQRRIIRPLRKFIYINKSQERKERGWSLMFKALYKGQVDKSYKYGTIDSDKVPSRVFSSVLLDY